MPCDGWYDTNVEVVEDIIRRCLDDCIADDGIKKVAMSVLATGYGNLPFEDFFPIAASVITAAEYALIEQILICIPHDFSFDEAWEIVSQQNLPLTRCERAPSP